MKRILVTAALVLGTAAWAGEDHDKKKDQGTGGAGEAGQVSESTRPVAGERQDRKPEMKSGGALTELGVTVPDDQAAFVSRLAHSNDLELQMAKLAQERATSKAVKQHAEKMMKDHTAMKEKVEQLAQKEQLTVTAPQPMDDREKKVMDAHHAVLAKLQVMEGMAFDQAYLTAMLDGHNEVIAKAMVASEQFRDTPLATMLKKELPRLEQHRKLTLDLLQKEKPRATAMRRSK